MEYACFDSMGLGEERTHQSVNPPLSYSAYVSQASGNGVRALVSHDLQEQTRLDPSKTCLLACLAQEVLGHADRWNHTS
jgi:hypothetical protein